MRWASTAALRRWTVNRKMQMVVILTASRQNIFREREAPRRTA